MPQGDVGGQDAASAPRRTTVQVVPQTSGEETTRAVRMAARTVSRGDILRSPQPEMEPEDDVSVEQRGVETSPPRASMEFFHAHPNVLDGDVRRVTSL